MVLLLVRRMSLPWPGTGSDDAVLAIGAGEIMLLVSAVGAAVVSGAGSTMVVSVGGGNGGSGAPGAGGNVQELLADGLSKSANAKPGAAGKAWSGHGSPIVLASLCAV